MQYFLTGLDKVLNWIMATATPNSSLKEALSGCEFVVRRGPLVRLAISPYINDGTQRLVCTKYKGTGVLFYLRITNHYSRY